MLREIHSAFPDSDTRVIEQHVNAPEFPDGRLDRPPAVGVRADVAGDEERPAAPGRDAGRGLRSPRPVDVKKDDGGPEFGEAPGRAEPDSRPGPGDNGHPAIERNKFERFRIHDQLAPAQGDPGYTIGPGGCQRDGRAEAKKSPSRPEPGGVEILLSANYQPVLKEIIGTRMFMS